MSIQRYNHNVNFLCQHFNFHEKINFENIYPNSITTNPNYLHSRSPNTTYFHSQTYYDSLNKVIYICNQIENFAFDLGNLNFDSSLCTSHIKCDKLPHFIYDPLRSFIPQMYHILQDYGLLFLIIGMTIHLHKGVLYDTFKRKSQRIPLSLIETSITNYINNLPNNQQKIKQIEIILRRIAAIKILRSFDVHTCLNRTPNSSHIPIDNRLNSIELHLERLASNIGYQTNVNTSVGTYP